MTQKHWFALCWQYTWVGAIATVVSQTFAYVSPALAQSNIVPDNTLGAESSVVTPNAQGLPRVEITGGAVRGANLFHSFQEFNVDAGRFVYFNADTGIQNILARVTGTNRSEIFGTLGTIGNSANLFLINPNGIIFGPNAALNVGGSFIGSTANALQFGNFGNFSADAPNAPSPLLTINPSALLFNQLSPASITNQSTASAGLNPIGNEVTGLRVPDGRSLLLVGGNVNLDGGNLLAYEGRIELAGLATPGSVGLDVAGNTSRLNVPNGVPRADVSLTNGAEVNVRAANGGSIALHARNVNMAGESKLRAGIESGLGTPNSTAGDIDIDAIGETILSDGSFIANVVQPQGVGKGGNININTGSLTLRDNAQLNAITFGQGNSGSVVVQASGAVKIVNSLIGSNVNKGAVGKAGEINISASSLSLADAQLTANIFGQGDGGRVIVQTSGAVSVDNSNIFSNLGASAVGNSGGILIAAESLSLTNGAQLQSSILGANASEPGGRGNAGSVNINVGASVTLAGVNQNGFSSAIFNDVEAGAVGNGGDINISAKSLSLTDGAVLDARTAGQGNGGNIIINASDRFDFDRKSGAFGYANTTVQPGAVGNAGDIRVTTGTLSLTNGAVLSSSTLGNGDAGNITIDARNQVNFSGGSSAQSYVFNSGVGKGGDIRVTTGSLSLTNGAQLASDTDGQGNAGNITIDARDTITLNGIGSNGRSSGLFSSVASTGVGNGGDIRLTTGSLTVSDGALLVSNTLGQGNGGNITIDARDLVTFDGVGSNQNSSGVYSTLESTAVGNAGNINVTTGSLSLNNGAQLSAGTYGSGKAGDITINAFDAITLNGTGSNGRSSGIFSTVGSISVNKGGDIRVKSGTLSLSNNALINASTGGRADAGNISVQVDDAVTLTNSSQIGTNVESGGVGKAGDIDILAHSLLVTDGAQIQSALERPIGILPAAQGRGGNIRVSTSDFVTLSGIGSTGFSSSLETGTDRETTGNAGNITVTTLNFGVSDAATVAAGSSGFGDGGNITINANSFAALNGGQVLTNTRGSGKAGTITLNVRDSLTLAGSDPNFTQRQAEVEQRLRQPGATDQLADVIGNLGPTSGIFANTAPSSTGPGGSIFIDPRQVSIRDGAKISVNSDGTGNAGNITLLADILTLDNGSEISGQTASSLGGNINLQLGEILLLRRGSQISTNAGTAQKGGDGGNINIDSKFIVAVQEESSDITANAFSGTGGRVEINTQGLFGIQPRSQPTQKSDITASSTLGVAGVVNINTPNTDALENSLTQLPENIIDANALIANSCIARRHNQSSGTFLITGNGGLPERPSDAPLSPYPTGTIRSIPSVGETAKPSTSTSFSRAKKNLQPIFEAQGIYRLANGDLVLSRECP